MWDLTQLAAFKACLRAASNRGMQTTYIQDALVQTDWDMLCAHPKIGVMEMYNIVAILMHRYGIVCPGSATLARAAAIVQTCAGPLPKKSRKCAFEMDTILKKLNKKNPWPFEYIQNYPRDPHELPKEVLDYTGLSRRQPLLKHHSGSS